MAEQKPEKLEFLKFIGSIKKEEAGSIHNVLDEGFAS